MSSHALWSVVHDADSEEVVLAADFPVTGRNEGGFVDLAPNLRLDCALWQTVAPALTPDSEVSGEEYLEPWLAEIRASGRTVRAVLGYCAGSVFAGVLAERIGQWQDPAPQVVVFDPELVDLPTVHLQFGRVVGNMTTVLSEEETAGLAATARELSEHPGTSPREFAAELFTAFRPVGADALRRAGLDEEYAGELVALVGAFMTYLSVAARLDPRTGWSAATVITSASPGSGLNRMRATEGLAAIEIGAERRFEVEHRNLLRTPAAAETVAGLLSRAAAGGDPR